MDYLYAEYVLREDDPGVHFAVKIAILSGWLWRRVLLVLLHAYVAAYAG